VADQDTATAAAKEILNNETESRDKAKESSNNGMHLNGMHRNGMHLSGMHLNNGMALKQPAHRLLLGVGKLCMVFEIIRSSLMEHFNILFLA